MDNNLEYSKDNKFIPVTSISTHLGSEIAVDLYYYTIQIVNICLFGNTEQNNEWVLIDTGMPKCADDILSVVESRFGSNSKPSAIILTHGHFDHVGAVIDLVKYWQIPVFAHELELPYLTGKMSYPEPDSTVEGGLVAKMSPIFPNEPINLGSNVEKLPSDGSVPGMHGWRWIHTPGHSPGHISLFREEDRCLIVGDAFVTVRQDSLYKVLVQKQEICGPPRYLTTDWQAAWESVRKLEALKPRIAVTGHGTPISGELLSNGLKTLVQEFDQVAIPDYGRYIDGTIH